MTAESDNATPGVDRHRHEYPAPARRLAHLRRRRDRPHPTRLPHRHRAPRPRRRAHRANRAGAVDRAVATVEEFRQIAAEHGATTIFVAATSAVRDASNGPELRERIKETSGLTVEIIGGDREAQLTFAGATSASACGTLLVADLGGGSMEPIAARNGAILPRLVRTRLRTAHRAPRHHADPPERAMVAAAEADARALLDPEAGQDPAG
ncbi:MAG: hypothetical protein U0232_06895 [Thermomicrobiales bacterium]